MSNTILHWKREVCLLGGNPDSPLPSSCWPRNRPFKLWQRVYYQGSCQCRGAGAVGRRTSRCVNFIKPFKAQFLLFLTTLQPTRRLRDHVHLVLKCLESICTVLQLGAQVLREKENSQKVKQKGKGK